MWECKVSLILDGSTFKLSYTNKDGRQNKVAIGNEKNITVMAARKISFEVNELLQSGFSLNHLKEMRKINLDAKKCGYNSALLKYKTFSIELAVKILYPEQYDEFLSDDSPIIKKDEKPFEILHIGCTGSGKTRFILSSILSPKGLRNFVPALTSLRETTACSILYHINASNVDISEKCNFKVKTFLKNDEEIRFNIKELIAETIEEYIVTLKLNYKEVPNIDDLCVICRNAVAKRLEMNYDKTFGLGIKEINKELAVSIEILAKTALLNFYGSSKSIGKLANEDPNYILKQLIDDYEKEQSNVTSEDIELMLAGINYSDIVEKVYAELLIDLHKYNQQYNQNGQIGEVLSYHGNTEDDSTLQYLSHVFGNKKKQRKGDFYTIEPIIKSAEFFLKSNQFSYKREIILSDSVGINQGQKDVTRINEVVFNRVQESVQTRKPDLIFYHTKIDQKDDYLLDIMKRLKEQGFGNTTYIIAGKLDEIFKTYLLDNYIEKSEVNEDIFNEFLIDTKRIYMDSDNITLNSIIGSHYFICDKTNKIADEYPYTKEYTCPHILDKILVERLNESKNTYHYDDVDFMNIIDRNNVAVNVYQRFLDSIPDMIPLSYHKMRWNTLQKAIEELKRNEYGFDNLYPAFKIKNAIANEFNSDGIKAEFSKQFGDNIDEIIKRYLIEVAEVSQVVLVTEYRNFMKKLLDMRYDSSLRMSPELSMTDERKENLRRLYSKCLEQSGFLGSRALQIVFHVSWIRTLDFFNRNLRV